MKKYNIKPLTSSIDAEILVPGSIGYTIRALNIAALTHGAVKILNPLKCEDTATMINALKMLGIKVEEGENYFNVIGDVSSVENKDYKINVGLSGRSARTLLALLSITPGIKRVDCDTAFKKRPVGGLIDALRMLGADIEYLEEENFLPVRIKSSRLHAGKVSVNGTKSSQYLSAILMIAPMVGEISIETEGMQVSKPFIDMTLDIMSVFGIKIKSNEYKSYLIDANQKYQNPNIYNVEPEATSCSYFFALAAITKSKIKIKNISTDSKQGDFKFVDILEKMGCTVVKNKKENWIEVAGGSQINGINIEMSDTPDLVPTLAVVAAFAQGITKITNIAHAKIKESDRIESPKNELLKMGIKVNSTDSALAIYGGNPHGASIDTHNDHRIAMSFAVAGAKIPGVVINNPEVVNKSFPNFWDKLEQIGIKLERRGF